MVYGDSVIIYESLDGGGGGMGVWYSLFIKDLAHYSSLKLTNYSLKVRKVAKKSANSLFINFFSNSLKNRIIHYF